MGGAYLVDIVFFVKSKGKGEYVVFLVVGTTVVEDILGRNSLPAWSGKHCELLIKLSYQMYTGECG